MKKTYNLLTVSILAVLLCLNTFAGNDNFTKYKKKNYSIEYPENWTLDKSETMGTTFILFAPLESSTDIFRENVNLIIQDLKKMNINLDQFVKISEEQVKPILLESTSLETKRVKNGDTEYHRFVYASSQGALKLKVLQFCWVVDEKAYILTFSAELNKYNEYKDIAEKVLSTFVVK